MLEGNVQWSCRLALGSLETKIDILAIKIIFPHLQLSLGDGSEAICELESQPVRSDVGAHDASHLC